MNIQIIRIYVRIREMIMLNKDVLQRLEGIERKMSEHDNKIMLIFEYLKQFEEAKQQQSIQENRKRIGFKKD